MNAEPAEVRQARERVGAAQNALDSFEIEHGPSPHGKPLPVIHEHNRLLEALAQARITFRSVSHEHERAVNFTI